MAITWIGLATTATRFSEGDAVVITELKPTGRMELRLLAWVGVDGLTDEDRQLIDRNVTALPQKRVRKVALRALGAAYADRAFDPAIEVSPDEIPVLDRSQWMTAAESR